MSEPIEVHVHLDGRVIAKAVTDQVVRRYHRTSLLSGVPAPGAITRAEAYEGVGKMLTVTVHGLRGRLISFLSGDDECVIVLDDGGELRVSRTRVKKA